MNPNKPPSRIRPILWATGFTAIAGVLYSITFRIFPAGGIWDGMALGYAGLFAEYGETNRMEHSVRQPWNTISNFAYLWVGFLILTLGWFDARQAPDGSGRRMRDHPGFSYLIGGSLVYLGVGSLFYHASVTRLGQQFDVGACYAVVLGLIACGVFRLLAPEGKERVAARVLIAGVIVADVLLLVFKWQIAMWVVLPSMGAALSLVVCLCLWRSRDWRGLGYAVSAMWLIVAAFGFRQLDTGWARYGIDGGMWWGHTLWHLLSAASLGSVYAFYRVGKEPSR
jgi:hypothetical protein